MKKTVKKLALSRETVRSLQHHQLTEANGGLPPAETATCYCQSQVATCFVAGCINGPTRINCTNGSTIC